jgi:hypothetical protein
MILRINRSTKYIAALALTASMSAWAGYSADIENWYSSSLKGALSFINHSVDSYQKGKTYTAPSCTGSAPCGGIVYANGGGYTVKGVTLEGKKSGRNSNPDCDDIKKKMSKNLSIGQYHTFIVPAACKYNLKFNIQSGSKHNKDLFLTPGCIIVTYSEGTTKNSNNLQIKKVDYVSAQAKAIGGACGKY